MPQLGARSGQFSLGELPMHSFPVCDDAMQASGDEPTARSISQPCGRVLLVYRSNAKSR